MGEDEAKKTGDGDKSLLEEFKESMLLEWLGQDDDPDESIEDEMSDDDETDNEEFRDSMLQEWLISDDEFNDDMAESEDMIMNKGEMKQEIKDLKDEIKAKENANKDLTEKLEKMERKASEDSNKIIVAERELAFANRTIDGLLKAWENDESSRKKEKDFAKALVMEKVSRETVTGDKRKEMRLETKKQQASHHRRQLRKGQRKNLMKVAPRMKQMKQNKLNMKLTSQQTMKAMQQQSKSMHGQREGSQPNLGARA